MTALMIIILLIGIAIFLSVSSIQTGENRLIKHFYRDAYGAEVKKGTVKSLKKERLGLLIEWIIQSDVSIVFLETVLSRKSLNILNRRAEDQEYNDFEDLLIKQRQATKQTGETNDTDVSK